MTDPLLRTVAVVFMQQKLRLPSRIYRGGIRRGSGN
jgi:hypothetical protein